MMFVNAKLHHEAYTLKTRVIFKQNSQLVVSAENLVLFWKIFHSFFYVSVDKDTINNSGKYLTSGICNFSNIIT